MYLSLQRLLLVSSLLVSWLLKTERKQKQFRTFKLPHYSMEKSEANYTWNERKSPFFIGTILTLSFTRETFLAVPSSVNKNLGNKYTCNCISRCSQFDILMYIKTCTSLTFFQYDRFGLYFWSSNLCVSKAQCYNELILFSLWQLIILMTKISPRSCSLKTHNVNVTFLDRSCFGLFLWNFCVTKQGTKLACWSLTFIEFTLKTWSNCLSNWN